MSVVIGFGAAVLWTALGVFITQNSTEENYGRHTGIFWSIFQFSQVFGNLGTYFVLPHLSSDTMLFIGFAAIATIGTLGLFGLKRPVPTAATMDGQVAQADKRCLHMQSMGCAAFSRSFCTSVCDTLRICLQPQFLLLVVMIFFSGMELSFWTGEFPQLLDTNVVGLVLTFAGIGEVVGGVAAGRIADSCGRSFGIVLGAACYGAGLALSAIIKQNATLNPVLAGAPLHAYFAAFLFGLGDSSFNTNIYSIISLLYDDKSKPSTGGMQLESVNASLLESGAGMQEHGLGKEDEDGQAGVRQAHGTHSVGAFTLFQLIQNLGSAFGFFYAIGVPMHGDNGTLAQVWVQAALMAVGVVLFAWSDVRYARRAGKGARISSSQLE